MTIGSQCSLSSAARAHHGPGTPPLAWFCAAAWPDLSPPLTAERAIRTLKEQLLWVRHFETVENLRQALAALTAQYNASRLRQRHSYKTPDQFRAELKAREPNAATGFEMVA